MKTLLRVLLFLTLFVVSCSKQPETIEAISSHSLDDFVFSDQNGVVLGVVDEVIVDSASGMIAYAVVTLPTEPHGISMAPMSNENQLAIPWRIVSIDPEHNALVFQLESSMLDDAPRLEKDIKVYSPQWDEAILQFWEPFLGER